MSKTSKWEHMNIKFFFIQKDGMIKWLNAINVEIVKGKWKWKWLKSAVTEKCNSVFLQLWRRKLLKVAAFVTFLISIMVLFEICQRFKVTFGKNCAFPLSKIFMFKFSVGCHCFSFWWSFYQILFYTIMVFNGKQLFRTGPATLGGGQGRNKKKKRKQRKKRKSVETIKMLSSRLKCYCFSHSTESRIQNFFLSANHGDRPYFSVFHGPSTLKSISPAL